MSIRLKESRGGVTILIFGAVGNCLLAVAIMKTQLDGDLLGDTSVMHGKK